MNNKFLASPLPALLAAFAILSAGTVHAAEEDVSKADPQRWYQEDNSPAQARSQDAARAQRIFKDYQGDAPAAAPARKGARKPPHKHGAMPAAK